MRVGRGGAPVAAGSHRRSGAGGAYPAEDRTTARGEERVVSDEMTTAANKAASTASTVLAIDIGGTKLAAGLVDPGGRVAGYARMQTPQSAGLDAEGLWRTVEALLA